MSKLLVSDYDGTYKTSEESVRINNTKLNEYMETDKFMFSTGRNYHEFFEEFEKYRLIADYYSLVDGNVLLDSDFHIISINTMPHDFIDSFRKFYPYFESVEKVDAFGNKTIKDVVEYKIVYKNESTKKAFIKFLIDNKIFSYHHNSTNKLVCHICNPYANKIDVIYRISMTDNIPKKNIYTIGDGYNDQAMIEEFNGYAMFGSKQAIIAVAKGIYDSVGDLADDIRRRKI